MKYVKIRGLDRTAAQLEKGLQNFKNLDTTLELAKYAPMVQAIVGLELDDVVIPPDLVKSEVEEVLNLYENAMPRAASALKLHLDAALVSPVWAWPSGGSRDIFDTGFLAASGSVRWDGKSLVINYSAPYADIVHDGGYIFPYGNKKIRPVYLPGRPWIRATLFGGGPVPIWSLADWLSTNVKL